jgi:hypothetical protein
MTFLANLLSVWRFKRQLARNLAARRTLRPQRTAAARKGWQTRRTH